MRVQKPTQLLKSYLARQYAKLYPRDIYVGVTGSVGKTTCVQSCKAVLSQKFSTITTESNLDYPNSFQSTLLRLRPKTKKVILEMGMNFKGQMDFYLSLIHPKIMVVTKISNFNCEYLGGIDEIYEEVAKGIRQLDEKGFAILNFDDPYSRKMAKDCRGQVIYFGTDPQNCTIWAGNIKVEDFRTTFELNLGVERMKINLPLLGSHQVYPVLAAAAVGIVNGVTLTKIKIGLESLNVLEHRMQTLLGPSNSIIIDDTMNSSPADLEAAIDTLLQVSARRRILVLGEMPNLGKYSEELHRQIAQKIYKEKIDLCFLGLGDTEIIASELKSLGFWEERLSINLQNSQMVSKLLKTLGKGDVVLVKGASAQRLDEVVKRVAKKTN